MRSGSTAVSQALIPDSDPENGRLWPLVSVVVVSRNFGTNFYRCLASVRRGGYPNAEIILVDNSDQALGEEVLKQVAPDENVRVIQTNRNLGHSLGCNLGFLAASGTYVCKLDDDSVLEPGCLEPMIEFMETHPDVGELQPKLLRHDQSTIEGTGDFVDSNGGTYTRGEGERDSGRYGSETEILSARSSCMIVRTSVAREIGGMDPDYFVYYDDLDFGWRVWLGGYRVLYFPKSIAIHESKYVSGRRFGNTRMSYSARNMLTTILKNCESRNFPRMFLARLSIELCFVFWLILKRDSIGVNARVRGLFWFFLGLRISGLKRRMIQARRKVKDDQLEGRVIFRMSLRFPRYLLWTFSTLRQKYDRPSI